MGSQRAGHDWVTFTCKGERVSNTMVENFNIILIYIIGQIIHTEKNKIKNQPFSSVQSSVVPNSSRPHELQHARPPCPSPSPGVHPNSCPSSWWCHPAISSSIVPFSSCPQSLPTSGSFPISQLFTSGGQSTGVLALASVFPKNTQGWSPLEWTGCSPRNSQESPPTPQFKSINSSELSLLHSPTLTSIHDHWKNHSLD